MEKENIFIVADEIIVNKIYFIRGQKVMIDRDLAALYGVETKRLKEAVKRNIKRFPLHFMFTLTIEERDEVVAKCDHLKILKFSPVLPSVFTEHGIIMLASILNSGRAIQTSIRIIEVFIKMREMLFAHKDILLKLEKMEQQVLQNSDDIKLIFDAIKQLLLPPAEPRKQIGYKLPEKD